MGTPSGGQGAAPNAAGSGGGSSGSASSGGSAANVAGSEASSGGSTSGQGGAAPIGGHADGGAAGEQAGGQAGDAGEGGTGGAPEPDPCEGVSHWSADERWTDYEVDELRVFGGMLFGAQNPMYCHTYPQVAQAGNTGWAFKGYCASGPVFETPACQCSAGGCCDGCYLRSRDYFCEEVVASTECSGITYECGPGEQAGTYRDEHYEKHYCDGVATACVRVEHSSKITSELCTESSKVCRMVGGVATCVPCAG